MTPDSPSRGSGWQLAPGVEPAEVPAALRDALDPSDAAPVAGHHIIGSDGATLDPDRLHITVDGGTMACGACGRHFRIPHLDLTVHGLRDKASSAYLECPHCRATIRVTALDDPSVPQPAAHWLATAQLTRPEGTTGQGWAGLKAAEIRVTEEGKEPASRSPRFRPGPEGVRRWPLLLAAGIAFLAGLTLVMVAANLEQLSLLIAGAVLLVLGGVAAIILVFRRLTDRRSALLATGVTIAVIAGVLIPATGAVMRCRSLSPGADLSACDLAAADLSERDLSGVDLSGAVLTDANLTGTRLIDADLSGGRLRGADLTGAELGSADLTGTSLEDVTLKGIQAPGIELAGADMTGLDLSGADLTGADLSSTDLSSAILTNAVFEKADLRDADLDNAVLGGAIFTDAVLEDASLVSADARAAVFTGANLTGADLDEIEASQAVLAGSSLSQSNLRGAVLAGADLTTAELASVDLRDADLTGARLTGATLSSAELSGTTGLTTTMLADALNVSRSDVVPAVIGNDLRFESPSAIRRAVSGAVRGKGTPEAAPYDASSRFHPIVAANDAPGMASWLRKLEGAWTSPGIRFTELVATESRGEQVIETCPYNVHPITRYRSSLHARVFAAKTGRLVAEKTFYGMPPRACQFTELVSTWDLRGDPVSHNAVFSWMKNLVHPLQGSN